MRYAITILLLLVLSISAHAQDMFGGITYEVAFPTGDTKDYTNSTSWRGIGIEGRKIVGDNLTAGLALRWQVFHKSLSGVTEVLEAGAITGSQNRTINAFPMLVTLDYYIGDGDRMKPFVGLGAGALYTKSRTEMGIYYVENSRWHFCLAPELGFTTPVGYDVDFLASGRYTYGTKTDDMGVSYVSIAVGFLWAAN